MTQKDIAKRVGVSVSTVSRVLSNKDTKAASKEVKEEPGYTGVFAMNSYIVGGHPRLSSD